MKLELVPQLIVECSHCSQESTEKDTADGLCENCRQLAGTHVCRSCDNSFVPEFLSSNADAVSAYPYCSDCALVCATCGKRTEELVRVRDWNENLERYEDTEICQACADASYVECDDCNETVHENSIRRIRRKYICNSCRYNYSTCDNCGELHLDHLQYDERSENYFCESCYLERSSSSIHSYSYQPSTLFFTENGPTRYPSGIFHGIELEVGWRNGDSDEYADAVVSALGDTCYLKEDSSILSANVNAGFEIVTHPCTLEYYRTALHSICDNSIPGLLSHNAGEGLGLHISVNRGALTNHAIARICAFIGADRNEKWLIKMARRKSNQWAEIIKKTCIEDTLSVVDGYEYLKTNETRYEAVNLQNGSHVEFRLFRGTLKYTSAMLCLEFVNALCRWSIEPAEVSDYQSAYSLLAFANKEPEVYPHLISFLCAQL